MNQLCLGKNRTIQLPDGGCLFITNKVPDIPDIKVFDLKNETINPLKVHSYESNETFVENIDALFTRGEDTLTKDTGLDFIAECLARKRRSLETLIPVPEKNASTGHVWAYGKIRRILRSPLLKHVLAGERGNRNTLQKNAKNVIVIDRRIIPRFDALALATFLISSFKGQIVVDDSGFYLRDCHVSLLDQDRLIIGVNFLDELTPKLRAAVMLIEDKFPCGALYRDAVELTEHTGYRPVFDKDDSDYNKMIDSAMGDGEMWAAC